MKKFLSQLVIFISTFLVLLQYSAIGISADTVTDSYNDSTKIGASSTNYTITGGQIKFPLNTPNLGWWKMNESSATTVADSSGNGFTGTGWPYPNVAYYPLNESTGGEITDYSGNANTASAGSGNIGYWRFNETSGTAVADTAGISASGTAAAGATVVDGKYGKARSFNDGTTAYIDVPHNATQCLSTAATFEFWMKTTGGDQMMISKNGWTGYYVYAPNIAQIKLPTNINANQSLNSATVVTDNTWHHVAFTWTSTDVGGDGKIRAYVDGNLDATATTGYGGSLATKCGTGVLRIGNFTGGGYPMQGILDELRIFDYARTQAQIQNDMNFGGSPVVAGKYSYGRSFDGSSYFIDALDSASLDVANTVTMEAWIYRAVDTGGWERILSKSQNGASATNLSYWMQISNTDLLHCGVIKSDETAPYRYSVATIPTGQWVHVACSNDATNGVHAYINGALSDGTTGGGVGAAKVSTYPLQIGRLGSNSLWYYTFNGYIDEVRIYNTIRTAQDITNDMNMTVPQVVAGQYSNARSFNGTSDYVSVAENDALDPAAITIEAWIKPSATVNGNIVNKGSNSGYRVRIASDGGLQFLDRGATNILSTTGFTYTLGQWYHVAFVGDASGLKIYVNGALNNSNGVAYGGPNTATELVFGKLATTEFFGGVIDDVRIYNYARTLAQITDDMNNKTYATTATVVSTNLIGAVADPVDSIDEFVVNAGTIPVSASINTQFSQDGSSWYSSTGVLNGSSANLVAGINTFDLSSLGWSGKNFYYRFTLSYPAGDTSPAINDVAVNITTSGSCVPPVGGDFILTKNCSFSNMKDGVDNGNIVVPTHKTLTINAGQLLGWNEGKGITIQPGGSIAINSGVGTIVNDSIGINDGTATGTTLIDGKYGKARNFAGSNDHILITHNKALEPSQFTISFWMKKNSEPDDWDRIITKESVPVNVTGYTILFNNSAPRKPYLSMRNTSSGETSTISLDTSLPLDTWTHYAFTFNGSVITAYKNGVALGSPISFTGTYAPATGIPMGFGATSDGSSSSPISLDDVRIYNVARDVTQVNADMNNSSPGSGVVAWWTMEDQAKLQQSYIWVKDDDYDSVADNSRQILSATQPTGYIRRKDILGHFTGGGFDGSCTPTSALNLNTTKCGSTRAGSAADAVFFSSTVLTSPGSDSITVSSTPTGLAVGDEILIINLKGTGSDFSNVGKYETKTITAISTNTLSVFPNIVNTYDGTTQQIMVQRVPHYTNVTVNNTYSLTASAFDGSKGGVIFFRATGTVAINSGGSITASSKGFRGGVKDTSGAEYYKGNWITGGATGTTGGSYARMDGDCGNPWYRGGNGGAGAAGVADAVVAAGATGGGGYDDCDGSAGGTGYTGGGGGGGSGDGGTGAGNGGGGGGKPHKYTQADGILTGTGATILSLGAGAPTGGGGGLSISTQTGGTALGGNNGNPGGGIIFIAANLITTTAANQIVSNGGTGGTGYVGESRTTRSGSGGGGSGGQGATGGPIFLKTNTLNLISNSITGKGGTGGAGGNGGIPYYQGAPQPAAAGGTGAVYTNGNDKGTAGASPGCCYGGAGGGGGNSGWAGVVKIWLKQNIGSLTTIPTATTTQLPEQ